MITLPISAVVLKNAAETNAEGINSNPVPGLHKDLVVELEIHVENLVRVTVGLICIGDKLDWHGTHIENISNRKVGCQRHHSDC